MAIEIDSKKDSWQDVANKLMNEFGVHVIAIQAGVEGETYGAHQINRMEHGTFRGMIGAMEFWKTKWIKEH
ncbi:MAG: hypothetical protein R6U10_04800 [Thermoplasmatota archaeon]